MKKLIFDVCGEFGYEILAVSPLVNWYFNQGYKIEVNTSIGSKYLYPNIKVNEIYKTRIPFLQLKINDNLIYKQHHHIGDMWTKPLVGDKMFWEDKWLPPKIKEFYSKRYTLKLKKPLFIISNKYQNEWGKNPVNFIDTPTLEFLFNFLSSKYTLVYNRPSSNEISNDNSLQLEFKDRILCHKLNIPTIQDFMVEYNLDYNETQIALYSNCNNFISTQGGNSAYASMFGGKNIIYGIKGSEISSNAYKTWFKLLSNQDIYFYNNFKELIDNVTNIF